VTIAEYTDYEPLLDAYTLAQEQGNPPEIIQLFEVGTQFAIDSGWFKPVSQIINGRSDVLGQPVNFDDIIPVVSSYYTVGGDWSSVAWNTSTPILYANTTLLSEAGIADIPTTWQEMEAACAQLQPMKDAGTIAGCITWPNHGWFYEQWLAQQNTELVNNGNGRDARPTEVELTTDASLNIVQWHQDMFNQGYYVYSGVQRDWTGTVQAFNSQQIPFIMTSSASAGGIVNDAAANGFEVITGKMLYDGDVPYTGNILGGATMWISNGLDVEIEEGALAFLLYFSNTENSASWHQVSGYVPVRNSSVELLQEEGWYEANPNFLTASLQLGESQVTTATKGAVFGTFVETRDIITQAIEDAMLLSGDVATIMASAEDRANTLLEE
jgi:sn-glycerol 3-phosphate transport system substrate-binding protein